MAKIELSKTTRDAMADQLRRYLRTELEVEVEAFDAVFLVDFITEKLGPQFYNQGLHDAQAVLQARLETLTEAIADLEQPVRT
ncbi:DUF2164 domain-containing protein [Phenylobacterium deserti]|uniref:DUF2164 domain-containing protein n=1 Tax=Phenylobacterium deserti TaxID=1914756 RepID=UPI001F0C5E42|nr:DUF2164 domain-containing protein [Phenylobacterium deserti]